jgi:hypothetical protein
MNLKKSVFPAFSKKGPDKTKRAVLLDLRKFLALIFLVQYSNISVYFFPGIGSGWIVNDFYPF